MAGRHGNKGVVSRILPEEDMPYLAGRHAGRHRAQPARRAERMNVGQILETHLGWAARELGEQIDEHARRAVRPRDELREQLKKIFDDEQDARSCIDELDDEDVVSFAQQARAAASTSRRRCSTAPTEDEIKDAARRWRVCRPAVRRSLFDGRTGEPFDHDVTVGVMYMLKLHHLVDDKIHARSIGPVLARHPAAARRQGAVRRSAPRRDGSVGAGSLRRRLRAAGVPHRQVATTSSGRTRMYEAIVKGEYVARAGPAGVLQRAHQGAPGAVPRRRADRRPDEPVARSSSSRDRRLAVCREVADRCIAG